MTSKKKTTQPPSEAAFAGKQIKLFQSFLCNSESARDKLSNTIELWDGVPKYSLSRQDMNKLRDPKGFLPTIERDFHYGGCAFTVKLRPARITDEEGKDKEFYPSAREEIVEDALRKIATEQGHGFWADQESGVMFTLHLLRKELKRRGHTLSYQEIIESLDVMIGCRVEIAAANGSGDYKSPILTDLMRVSRKKYLEDPQASWLVHFSPLVARSIHMLTYRQYDYHTMMSHTTQLARWLHKRLAHNYVNASITQSYTVLFSTIRRDSGLLEYNRLRDAVHKLDDAFVELQEHHILLTFQKEERTGERNKILDVSYTLTPHPQFVSQIKAANKRQNDALRQ